MKKRLPLCLSLTLICTSLLFAQDTSKAVIKTDSAYVKNAWYFEFAGASILGVTFNYERSFSKKPGGLCLRAGFGGGFIAVFDEVDFFAAIPFGLSYNIPVSPDKRHFIEIGGTYTTILEEGGNTYLISPNLGWRFMAAPKGVQLRATLIPYIFPTGEDEGGIGPWFGFSVGKRF